MVTDMKYIIFKDPNFGIETPIIFPSTIKHSDMVYYLKWEFVSAGFVKLNGAVQTFGESVSLNVESRKEDANLIARFL